MTNRLSLILALALGLAACSTLTSDDQQKLTLHLENAAQYYDQRHYEAAYQQWDLALEYDPVNAKARLGQAMVYYFLGLEDSPRGVERLSAAEERLEELLSGSLDGLELQARLGWALVNDRWVQLLSRKVQQIEYLEEHAPTENAEVAKQRREELDLARSELDKRSAEAAAAYRDVYSSGEQEQFQLMCMVGLAKMAAYRGDFDAALEHAREYGEQIERSKELWRDAIERYPREAALWEQKLAGAESQEAEVRDLTANVLYKLGRLEDAEKELTAVIQIDSTREGAFLNRGIVRQERRDWDRARQDLRTFLHMTERGDDDPSVLEAQVRLEAVEERIEEENAAALDAARRGL